MSGRVILKNTRFPRRGGQSKRRSLPEGFPLMDQEYESNRPYRGVNAATPPRHSWTIKLMEKTIARLTSAINQMRL